MRSERRILVIAAAMALTFVGGLLLGRREPPAEPGPTLASIFADPRGDQYLFQPGVYLMQSRLTLCDPDFEQAHGYRSGKLVLCSKCNVEGVDFTTVYCSPDNYDREH